MTSEAARWGLWPEAAGEATLNPSFSCLVLQRFQGLSGHRLMTVSGPHPHSKPLGAWFRAWALLWSKLHALTAGLPRDDEVCGTVCPATVYS